MTWRRERISLESRFGERHVFSATFDAVSWTGHFMGVEPSHVEPELPEEALDCGCSAVLISFPVARPPTPRLRRAGAYLRYVPSTYRRFFVDLTSRDFAKYLQKFSSKTRANLLKKVKRYSEHSGGVLSWRTFATADEHVVFHALAREVSRKTYQERLLKAGLPDGAAFRSELCALAERNAIRSYILFHESRPIAYMCCPAREGILLYQYVGYDPDFREWSPGVVLQYLVLESLFSQERFSVFDFTPGEGAHKELFATGSLLCADIYFIRRGIRNTTLALLHAAVAAASRTVTRATERIGVKAALKRFLRHRA